MTSGAKRYELPVVAGTDGVPVRPALHVVTDEGCVGRVALLYLMSRAGLRGSALGDPLHRHWNDTKLAIKASSLWSVVQEYTCVFNVHMAPWNQSAFHSIIAQVGHEYFQNCDESNGLYKHMYEELAEERAASPMEWATSEHYTNLWRSLAQSKHLRSEGDHVKLGRWYSFFKEADARSESLAELQLILLYIGVQQGWWKDFESSPLGWRESLKEDLLQREPPVQPGAGSSRMVSLSNEQEDLKQMRSSCRNTLEVVTRILSNTHRRRLLHCMRAAIGPFRECFQRLQTTMKTRGGRGESMVDWAAGTEISLVCSSALSSLHSAQTMKALKLKTESDSHLLESEVEEEVDVANHYFKLVVALVGQHLQSSLTYSHSLPCMLAALLSKNQDLKLAKLADLKILWEWLMAKESQSLESMLSSRHSWRICNSLVGHGCGKSAWSCGR
eukprot:6387649-Amphidinium_carterae.2